MKIDTWHRIEENGSGDYYLVPVGLFNIPFNEAACTEDPEIEKLINEKCIYIGGFSSQVMFKGEAEKC